MLAKVKQTRKESDVQLWLTVAQAAFGGNGLFSRAQEKQAAQMLAPAWKDFVQAEPCCFHTSHSYSFIPTSARYVNWAGYLLS